MPVKSEAERGFMAMSRTPEGRAKLRAHGKKPASVAVASEFLKASKGQKNLPEHAPKK